MIQTPTTNNVKSLDGKLLKARKRCQAHGSGLTRMRKQVLSLLLTAKKAISAYELIDLFESTFDRKMAPTSIYRILDYLEQTNLVHKINTANRFVACVNIGDIKSHVVTKLLFCQQCKRVQETPISDSIHNHLTNEIEQSGYQLCSQIIELTCICSACSNKNQLT
jgi:Fur family zinc uptake transcriptional regulator